MAAMDFNQDPVQGNRVKDSCCNEGCEEFVVPGGDLAFEA
jgi:hypothetical protein